VCGFRRKALPFGDAQVPLRSGLFFERLVSLSVPSLKRRTRFLSPRSLMREVTRRQLPPRAAQWFSSRRAEPPWQPRGFGLEISIAMSSRLMPLPEHCLYLLCRRWLIDSSETATRM
jgi:hypothetical protein